MAGSSTMYGEDHNGSSRRLQQDALMDIQESLQSPRYDKAAQQQDVHKTSTDATNAFVSACVSVGSDSDDNLTPIELSRKETNRSKVQLLETFDNSVYSPIKQWFMCEESAGSNIYYKAYINKITKNELKVYFPPPTKQDIGQYEWLKRNSSRIWRLSERQKYWKSLQYCGKKGAWQPKPEVYQSVGSNTCGGRRGGRGGRGRGARSSTVTDFSLKEFDHPKVYMKCHQNHNENKPNYSRYQQIQLEHAQQSVTQQVQHLQVMVPNSVAISNQGTQRFKLNRFDIGPRFYQQENQESVGHNFLINDVYAISNGHDLIAGWFRLHLGIRYSQVHIVKNEIKEDGVVSLEFGKINSNLMVKQHLGSKKLRHLCSDYQDTGEDLQYQNREVPQQTVQKQSGKGFGCSPQCYREYGLKSSPCYSLETGRRSKGARELQGLSLWSWDKRTQSNLRNSGHQQQQSQGGRQLLIIEDDFNRVDVTIDDCEEFQDEAERTTVDGDTQSYGECAQEENDDSSNIEDKYHSTTQSKNSMHDVDTEMPQKYQQIGPQSQLGLTKKRCRRQVIQDESIFKKPVIDAGNNGANVAICSGMSCDQDHYADDYQELRKLDSQMPACMKQRKRQRNQTHANNHNNVTLKLPRSLHPQLPGRLMSDQISKKKAQSAVEQIIVIQNSKEKPLYINNNNNYYYSFAVESETPAKINYIGEIKNYDDCCIQLSQKQVRSNQYQLHEKSLQTSPLVPVASVFEDETCGGQSGSSRAETNLLEMNNIFEQNDVIQQGLVEDGNKYTGALAIKSKQKISENLNRSALGRQH